MDYCTLKYTPPKDVPGHLAGAVVVKMVRLPAGALVQVPADVAGVIMRGDVPGVAVVSGTPAAAPAPAKRQTVATAKQALRAAMLGAPPPVESPAPKAEKGKAKAG